MIFYENCRFKSAAGSDCQQLVLTCSDCKLEENWSKKHVVYSSLKCAQQPTKQNQQLQYIYCKSKKLVISNIL